VIGERGKRAAQRAESTGGSIPVARLMSVVLGLAVVAALLGAALYVLRFSSNGFRGLVLAFGRLVRRNPDHPCWELLAQ
jgi:hypothetical protein